MSWLPTFITQTKVVTAITSKIQSFDIYDALFNQAKDYKIRLI